MNLGERIKYLRLQKRITQEELASALDASVQTISRWENNVTTPDIDAVVGIANFFGVSTDMVLGVKKPLNTVRLLKTRETFECKSNEQADELILSFKESYFPKLLSYAVTEEDGRIILTVEKEFGAELGKMRFDKDRLDK